MMQIISININHYLLRKKEEANYLKMGPAPPSQTVIVRHHEVTKTTKENGTPAELFLMIQQGTRRFIFFVIKIFKKPLEMILVITTSRWI